jgi:NADH-quinone oxidoreductase subunit M
VADRGGAVPLVGALVIALIPRLPQDSAPADRRARDDLAKWLALAFSLATMVVVIVIAVKFQVGGPNYQFTESYSWIPAFGVNYAVGVDGIALVLIAMSAVLMPAVILASWNDAETGRHGVKTYFALMLVLETMMIGVFAARRAAHAGRGHRAVRVLHAQRRDRVPRVVQLL